jgi:hypothetical protein
MMQAVQHQCSSGAATCSYPCSPPLCLPICKLHACTRAARLPHGIGTLEVDWWCLTHATAGRKHSFRTGSALALDLLETPARRLTAWPRSKQARSAIMAADLADMVQTRWRPFRTNAANTATSRIRPYDGRSQRRPGARFGSYYTRSSLFLSRARGPRVGVDCWISRTGRWGPKNRSPIEVLQPPARIIWAHYRGSRIGIFAKTIPEKPSAVSKSLEINWRPR